MLSSAWRDAFGNLTKPVLVSRPASLPTKLIYPSSCSVILPLCPLHSQIPAFGQPPASLPAPLAAPSCWSATLASRPTTLVYPSSWSAAWPLCPPPFVYPSCCSASLPFCPLDLYIPAYIPNPMQHHFSLGPSLSLLHRSSVLFYYCLSLLFLVYFHPLFLLLLRVHLNHLDTHTFAYFTNTSVQYFKNIDGYLR